MALTESTGGCLSRFRDFREFSEKHFAHRSKNKITDPSHRLGDIFYCTHAALAGRIQ